MIDDTSNQTPIEQAGVQAGISEQIHSVQPSLAQHIVAQAEYGVPSMYHAIAGGIDYITGDKSGAKSQFQTTGMENWKQNLFGGANHPVFDLGENVAAMAIGGEAVKAMGGMIAKFTADEIGEGALAKGISPKESAISNNAADNQIMPIGSSTPVAATKKIGNRYISNLATNAAIVAPSTFKDGISIDNKGNPSLDGTGVYYGMAQSLAFGSALHAGISYLGHHTKIKLGSKPPEEPTEGPNEDDVSRDLEEKSKKNIARNNTPDKVTPEGVDDQQDSTDLKIGGQEDLTDNEDPTNLERLDSVAMTNKAVMAFKKEGMEIDGEHVFGTDPETGKLNTRLPSILKGIINKIKAYDLQHLQDANTKFLATTRLQAAKNKVGGIDISKYVQAIPYRNAGGIVTDAKNTFYHIPTTLRTAMPPEEYAKVVSLAKAGDEHAVAFTGLDEVRQNMNRNITLANLKRQRHILTIAMKHDDFGNLSEEDSRKILDQVMRDNAPLAHLVSDPFSSLYTKVQAASVGKLDELLSCLVGAI
jgi:hypothetical protein